MKKYIIAIFILVAVAQWVVPVNMIWKKEHVIQNGKAFHFKTAPVDPSDAFRGAYIELSYDLSREAYETTLEFNSDEDVYVTLKESADGYAEIDSLSKVPPSGTPDFVKAKATGWYRSAQGIYVVFPFETFYMEESKAPKAEKEYRRASRDSSEITYAVVMVLNGESAIVDVKINNESIGDLAGRRTAEEPEGH